ncbi:MAG: sigma-70 family RNA polymerase sigma factor [Myxococcaceae bacterium]|nr:sigma-70 family RNA polymerase sigma factor [Myxococcaceae bacterium]MCA3012536.1 sigma-70 family RNA polymerase sigma factor [Myxococcaceae bacterium]
MRLDAPAETRNGARVVEHPEDSELLRRAQRGDMAAFEALVARHQNRVFGMAARMLRSDDDAAEVVQEAFLAAYKHLPEFRGESAFGSWVYRIAANYALMRLRHRRVTAQVEEPEGSPTFNERGSLIDDVADWSRDAEAQTLDAELRKAIDDAAQRLPEEYRQVFLLRDVEGLSYEEIAQAVGDSVPAIKSRLHRARLALRAAIDRFYAERAS